VNRTAFLSAAFGASLALGVAVQPAEALSNRTWVSGKGADSGACGLATPCRTFAYAITQTNAGGEVDVLDPAGYGAVTIGKAISIINDGVGTAGVQIGSGGTAITVAAGANDAVLLRGLTIEGTGIGAIGVQFSSGASLVIEKCTIRDFTGKGVFISPSSTSSFAISDTVISHIGFYGIYVIPSGSAGIDGLVSNVSIENAGAEAVDLSGSFSTSTSALGVSVVNSIAANSGGGFFTDTSANQAATVLTVRDSASINNGAGLGAIGPNAALRLSRSVVVGNSAATSVSNGGAIYTYGDNGFDVTVSGLIQAGLQ